jgi:putative phage-type endonuclease
MSSDSVGHLPMSELTARWEEAVHTPFCFNLANSVEEVQVPCSSERTRRVRPPAAVEAANKRSRSMPFLLDVEEVEELPPRRNPPMTREEWMQRLEVTQEQAEAIKNYEQGTAAWLQSRVGRITGSNFGAAIGVNKYTSPRALLKQMLWGEFKGNAATRWGSENEDVARDEYVEVKRAEIATAPESEDAVVGIQVEECGLVINPERPWMGNSPDGIITLTYKSGASVKGLLEIKCPYRKEFYTPDPVPTYYYAQIQGTMGNLGLPWCDFVVWTPTAIQVTRVPFDQTYWDTKLLPGVTSFYFDKYLPLALHKENGTLRPNSLDLL